MDEVYFCACPAEMLTTEIMMNPKISVPIFTGIAAVSGIVWWMANRTPEAKEFPDFLAPELIVEHQSREQNWDRGDWQSLDQTEVVLAPAWNMSIHDPVGLTDESQRDLLLDLLGRFALAYARPTADDYITLVDSLPWLDWRTDRDSVVRYLEYYTGEPDSDTTAPTPEMLRVFWPAMMIAHGMGWGDIGVGAHGALISIEKVYADQPGNGLGALALTEAEFDHWDGAPMHAYFHNVTRTTGDLAPAESVDPASLSSPRSVLPAILKRGPSAVVAYCHVLAKTRQDWPFVWQSRWVWDDSSYRWICDEMVVATGRGLSGIF